MRVAIVLLAAGLVALTAVSAGLLLQGCGLRLPVWGVLSACDPVGPTEAEIARAQQDRETRALTQRIAALEQQLAGLACKPAPPPPPAPVVVPKPPEPPAPQTESGLAPGAFDGGDVSVMEGCWELVTEFTVHEQRTGQVDVFRNFEVCFDANGNGRQVKQSTRGTRCEGSVQARIDFATLIMTEPADLECTNGITIYRAITNCTVDATGRATCRGIQPEVNAQSELFIMRRKGRAQ